MFFTLFEVGEILTLISYLVYWISRFIKSKNNILILDTISRVFAIIAFVFLGTYDGIKNTIYVILRNSLGQVTNKKSINAKIITFITMLMLLIVIYSFNFNGISTICIAISGILNLFGVIMCKEQGMRIFGMLGSSFYATFMFCTGNIVGTICEIIGFFMVLLSYLKYRNNN